MIKEKINAVAYRLQLPEGSCIYLVFHIALLKNVVGEVPDGLQQPLPLLDTRSQPVVIPHQIMAYRRVLCWGTETIQVLAAEECSWEDLEYVQSLVPTLELEDKLRYDDGGDVTIPLNIHNVTKQLVGKLEELNNDHRRTGNTEDMDPDHTRPIRTRKSTQWVDFIYE